MTVTVGGAVEDVTVAPEELTFTTLNWSRAQTVTVSAAEDDDAVVDAAVTLTHEVSGGGYDGVTAADVEVTVIENDFVGVTVAPEALEVLEGGSETYTVVLDAEPTGPVTVTVEGAAGDLTVSLETLSFTRSNWSTRKLVTVSAAEDEDSIVDAPVTLDAHGKWRRLRRGDRCRGRGNHPRKRHPRSNGDPNGTVGHRGK